MDRKSIKQRIKQWIAGIGFRLFLWVNEKTEEEYWEEIYQQEKYWRMNNHIEL